MQLFIKNMVCDRCILVIRQELERHHLPYRQIQLGEVELLGNPDKKYLEEFRKSVEKLGFELLDDKKSALVSKIKTVLLKLIHGNGLTDLNTKISVLLAEELQHEYAYLSALFSSIEGITIEKYVIAQRIERAKELLLYNELSLSQIADQLGYSSVQHLSQQFKKITGLTPTHFKEVRDNKRTPLDQVGR
ncbi:helix-turn-helix transcriptional regulator [Flavihumibacter sp. CACIAM 22H1]|uniref:helix-turn-helix domain-containing protein n=1 Tax=Flavihumibacter sp. CACIAM 22H1 TaxID=1812911 RepID=UPI0007A9306F|nr:helix-turn-helix transcriptional regulator [Flavihumibacter sp. CACIAM 22H1]KYP13737.1 MAG: AraC family transcriptional regulator [Flavihumibacter sp. CACIAM 22H1]